MKHKIKIKDFKGELTILEKKSEDKDHLASQIKYPKIVYKNKKKYTRKIKHKSGGQYHE